MRYVQINSFYNGSTGTIMRNLHKELKEQGIDSYIFWGRRHETISDHEICCASKLGVYAHGALSRLTDRAGFYSKRDTRRLLEQLDEIDPDVVHLHNIHGYYVNVELLFEWLAQHRCQVKWTLHDCWAFTGHCSHFTYVGCERWRDGCHDCPQKREYPKSLCLDSSVRNFYDKKRSFNLIPVERMTIITPSQWLADLVGRSFLSKYPVTVKHNTVDRSVFKPAPSDFRKRYGLEDKFVILGVASPWTERKGLGLFIELARILNDRFAIVLVGLNEKQCELVEREKGFSARVVPVAPVIDAAHLAEVYSAADFFWNASIEETFGMTTLEAISCGVQAIVCEKTPGEEIVKTATGVVLPADASTVARYVACSCGIGNDVPC